MKVFYRTVFLILSALLLITVIALIFVRSARVFGISDSSKAQSTYEKRADNYYDGRFHNEVELSDSEIDETDPHKDRTTGKGTEPEDPLPVKKPSFSDCSKDDVEITWFGHTTILIRMHGMNILTDPIFSDYMGLNSTYGCSRFESISRYMKDLPHIDLCMLTHDHYDHLDYESIRKLDGKIDRYIVPLGVEQRLKRFGVSSEKITNMAWWEEQNAGGLHIACTPAQHSSGRVKLDEKMTLWCSYVFYDRYHRIFLTGDTGFGPHFKEIHDAYGDMDLVLTDGAQYGEEKDKHTNHMFPEESAKAAEILKADKAMIIHWGSFCLSDWHAWDDPPSRFEIACNELDIDYISSMIGQTFLLSDTENLHKRWWKNLK